MNSAYRDARLTSPFSFIGDPDGKVISFGHSARKLFGADLVIGSDVVRVLSLEHEITFDALRRDGSCFVLLKNGEDALRIRVCAFPKPNKMTAFIPDLSTDFQRIVGFADLNRCDFDETDAAVGLYLKTCFQDLILAEANELISRLDVAKAAAQTAAARDPLTGLLNRRGLDAWWAEWRVGRRGTAVLHLDLDHFKPINDSLGHASGDRVLAVVAARLSNALRQEDAVARIGGDEFLVVCAPRSIQHLRSICDRVVGVFDRPVSLARKKISVSCSIGVAWNARNGTKPMNVLIDEADAALYIAKKRRTGLSVLRETRLSKQRSPIAA
ncbi:MAG: GGDEF domain-containing protein [Pseudomonadota bacterium]